MSSRRSLERRLETLAGFDDPRLDLEQYLTPAAIAAHVVHLAGLRGDLGRIVVDLGAGTGILALGAAVRGAEPVLGIERDANAIAIARENERLVDPPAPVQWIMSDATRVPLCCRDATVLMNPPFGAQAGAVHADREFLATAAEIAAVSYSIHNAGSREFVEAFAGDRGGRVTEAFTARIDLPRQFDFHEEARTEIAAEVFRIVWNQ